MHIGILAEDQSDCDALAVLCRRIAAECGEPKLGICRAWGKGCARLRAKAGAKLKDMSRKGCVAAIIVHDLDRHPNTNMLNDPDALRSQLEAIACPAGILKLVCIPVEELEAWFWADDLVVKEVGRGRGSAHPSPHLIVKPKEKLMALSVGENRKPRFSTNENSALAELLSLDVCASRCEEFALFVAFVRGLFEK